MLVGENITAPALTLLTHWKVLETSTAVIKIHCYNSMVGIKGAAKTQEFYPNVEGPWSFSLKICFAFFINFKSIQIE